MFNFKRIYFPTILLAVFGYISPALAGSLQIVNLESSHQDVFVQIKNQDSALCFSSNLPPGHSLVVDSGRLSNTCDVGIQRLRVKIVPGNVVSTNAISCFWNSDSSDSITLTAKDGKLEAPGSMPSCAATY